MRVATLTRSYYNALCQENNIIEVEKREMKKINWGVRIVISFALFIIFILYFVVKTITDIDYEYDLVTKDYYKEELKYQQQIDKLENSKKLKKNIFIKLTPEGVLIEFPKEFVSKEIKGVIYLYRPSNKVLDREIPISISNSSLLIPKKMMVTGRWNINIDWPYNGTEYLYKTPINY